MPTPIASASVLGNPDPERRHEGEYRSAKQKGIPVSPLTAGRVERTSDLLCAIGEQRVRASDAIGERHRT